MKTFETVRTSSLKKLFSVLSTDRSSAFVVQKYLDENKDKAENIFVFWLAYLRDIILMQSQAPNMIINIDKKDMLRQLAAKYDTDYLMNMSKRVIKAKNIVGTICEFKSHFAVVVAKIRIKRGISIKIIFVSIFSVFVDNLLHMWYNKFTV